MNPEDFEIGKLIPLLENNYGYIWVFLIIGLIFIALARTNQYGIIRKLFTQTTRIESKLFNTNSLSVYLLFFNYILILSAFIFLLNNSFSSKTSIPLLLLFISILIFYILKTSILIGIATLFNRKTYFDITNNLKYYQITGLILLPIVGFSYFQTIVIKDTILLIGVLAITITILLHKYKSLVQARQFNISYLYIILYLCTLEILPALYIIKYFI